MAALSPIVMCREHKTIQKLFACQRAQRRGGAVNGDKVGSLRH